MKLTLPVALFAAVFTTSSAVPSGVSAEPATRGDRGYTTFGVYFAMGKRFREDTNDYRFGAAAQLGFTLPLIPLYIGGFVNSYAGEKPDDFRTCSNNFGLDLGVDLQLFTDRLILRPLVGIGAELIRAKVNDREARDSGFLLLPGGALLVLLDDHFFLGTQLRYSMAPHGGSHASGFHFLAGLGGIF